MFGSPDSSEPVRHVCVQCFQTPCEAQAARAASHITGPLCPAVAAVLAKLSSSHRSCQAALHIGHRHISADLEPGSESESCNVQDDVNHEHHLEACRDDRAPPSAGHRGPPSCRAEHSRHGSFPLSARLCCLACHPAARRSWQANDFMTFVQSCFVTPRPHGQATGQNTG